MIRKVISIYLSIFMIGTSVFSPGTAIAQDTVYTVAILNMDAKGVSQVEAEVLSERLRAHVSQLVNSEEYKSLEGKDQYQVVEQTQIDKIFEQFEIQNMGCVSDSCAIEFGKMLQVDRILIGQVGRVGNTFSISARIVDVESGKAIAHADAQHKGSIDDLMGRVIMQVGDELFMGKKKSRKMWYIVGGALLVGAGAAAALGGGDSGGSSTPVLLPEPPTHP